MKMTRPLRYQRISGLDFGVHGRGDIKIYDRWQHQHQGWAMIGVASLDEVARETNYYDIACLRLSSLVRRGGDILAQGE